MATMDPRALLRERIDQHGGMPAVARALGVTSATLYGIIAGEPTPGRVPSLRLALKIQALLNIAVEAWGAIPPDRAAPDPAQ